MGFHFGATRPETDSGTQQPASLIDPVISSLNQPIVPLGQRNAFSLGEDF